MCDARRVFIRRKGKIVLGPVEHPWFDPLWRRVLLVLFCGAWAGMEYYLGNITWVYIIGAITGYAAWAYLIGYKGPDDPSRKTRPRMDDNDG